MLAVFLFFTWTFLSLGIVPLVAFSLEHKVPADFGLVLGWIAGGCFFLSAFFIYALILLWQSKRLRRLGPAKCKPTLEILNGRGDCLGLYVDTREIAILSTKHRQKRFESFDFIREWDRYDSYSNTGEIIGCVLVLRFNSFDFPSMRINLSEKKMEQFDYLMSGRYDDPAYSPLAAARMFYGDRANATGKSRSF